MKSHNAIIGLMPGLLLLAVGTLTAHAANDDNIFGAGHAVAPAPGGGIGGSLPPSYSFAAASGQMLTFSSVTGTITGTITQPNNGPDGGTVWNSDINSVDGVSGIISDASFFLVGVFLDGTEPTNPAALRLDFSASGLNTDFTSLSPLLNQIFFIGDGLTGTGTGATQQFHVPETATRLFLGIADANDLEGDPGQYQDNTGSFNATFAVVPEPSRALLTLLGLGVVLMGRRRR